MWKSKRDWHSIISSTLSPQIKHWRVLYRVVYPNHFIVNSLSKSVTWPVVVALSFPVHYNSYISVLCTPPLLFGLLWTVIYVQKIDGRSEFKCPSTHSLTVIWVGRSFSFCEFHFTSHNKWTRTSYIHGESYKSQFMHATWLLGDHNAPLNDKQAANFYSHDSAENACHCNKCGSVATADTQYHLMSSQRTNSVLLVVNF